MKKIFAVFLVISGLCVCGSDGFIFTGKKGVPEDFAGRWAGDAVIIVSWCEQKKLSVDITIGRDGKVVGKVGDAELIGGRFSTKPKWFIKLLNHKTHYLIKGKLEGDIVSAEKINRKSAVLLLTEMIDDKIYGGLHSSGWHIGNKKTMVLTAINMQLERKGFRPIRQIECKNDIGGKECFVDFCSGETFYMPEELGLSNDSWSIMRWAKKNGIDIGVQVKGDTVFVGSVDSAFKRIDNKRWDTITVEQLTANKELTGAELGGGNITKKKKDLPASYIFRTSDGRIGIMQLQSIVDERTVVMRYKIY